MSTLSKPTTTISEPKESLAGRYMSFMLKDEEYCVSILKVREIISAQDSTPIPRMPACVRGVINLRGRIVPLVDLRLKLGLGLTEDTPQTCIIVTEVTREGDGELMQFGCIVDAVRKVIDLNNEQLEPTPILESDVDVSFILGLGKSENSGKFTTLLDLDCVLADLASDSSSESGLDAA
jgi:purine-binding chemotaxis protein CheW